MRIVGMGLIVALLFVPVVVQAKDNNELVACKKKREAIEREISYIRENGPPSRIAILHDALERLESHCEAAALIDAAEEVDEARADLRKAEGKLKKAKELGNPGKIADREENYIEAQEELEEAEQTLERIYNLIQKKQKTESKPAL